jgi:predicted PurR-regulated permease PerM
MDYSAPHTGLVIASYLISALCLVALTFYVLRRDRQLAAKLKSQTPKEEQ